MPKKIILTETDEKLAIELYSSGQITNLEKLASRFSVGKNKMRLILDKNTVTRNPKGGQIKNDNTELIIKSQVKKLTSSNDSKKLVARCKKSGIIIDDAMNYSGSLTKHIISTYNNVNVPSNTYQRKKYEIRFGKKWYEEYFDIIEVEVDDKIECEICKWSTLDINNRSGVLTSHIKTIHNLTISQYINLYPNSSIYWSNFISNKIKLSNDNDTILCLECNEKFLGLTETHMNSIHNISLREYKKKWGENTSIFSENTLKILSENAVEINKYMEHSFISKPQQEIRNFIEDELSIITINNDKKSLSGVELDILVPTHNLAIEFNGLYWHTESLGKYEKYHIEKTELANINGIKLIHIFEDEWKYKKDIVKNRLRHILGCDTTRLYARNTEIKLVDSTTKDIFLNGVHIQGTDKSSIRLGAYIGDSLVGVMTFSKLRKVLGYKDINSDEYELVRFASLNVIGLASKLFNHFTINYKPKKIISYADRRWSPESNNCVYPKLGFKFIENTKPNYWYTKNFKEREHRYNFRKDILVDLGYDKNKTEREIMSDLGYHRIWDCGSAKFIWEVSQ
jgi:hypothetical protein